MTELEIEFFRGKIKGFIIAHDTQKSFGDCLAAIDKLCGMSHEYYKLNKKYARQKQSEMRQIFINNKLMSDLCLDQRTQAIFDKYNIDENVLMQLGERGLLGVPGFGRKSLNLVKSGLEILGLTLPFDAKLRWDYSQNKFIPFTKASLDE